MPPLAQTALAASIVLSALGAVIICALTAFYGFTPEGEEPVAETNRRRLLTRVGHAMAAACFAGTAILLAVVLAQPTRPGSAPAVDTRVPALDARVEAQALRLQGVEQRMKDSEQTLQRLEMEVSEVSARRMGQDGSPAALEPPAKDEQTAMAKAVPRPRAASVAPPKPAAVKPTPSAVKPTPSAAKPAERPVAVAPPPTPKQPERPTVVVAPPPPVTPSTERGATSSSEPAASASMPSAVTPSLPPMSPPPAAAPLPSAITPPAAVPPTSPLSSRPSGASHGAAAAAPREQAPASSSGLIGKFRDDWRAIQRGWENAGEDFRKATAPLRGEN